MFANVITDARSFRSCKGYNGCMINYGEAQASASALN